MAVDVMVLAEDVRPFALKICGKPLNPVQEKALSRVIYRLSLSRDGLSTRELGALQSENQPPALGNSAFLVQIAIKGYHNAAVQYFTAKSKGQDLMSIDDFETVLDNSLSGAQELPDTCPSVLVLKARALWRLRYAILDFKLMLDRFAANLSGAPEIVPGQRA